MNVEAALVAHLNGIDDRPAEAFLEVPSPRPERFVTVERTGGGRRDVRDLPSLAVQCWAKSRYEASELARAVAGCIEAFRAHPRIGRVEVSSVYNFPDLESGSPRYQMTVEIVTV